MINAGFDGSDALPAHSLNPFFTSSFDNGYPGGPKMVEEGSRIASIAEGYPVGAGGTFTAVISFAVFVHFGRFDVDGCSSSIVLILREAFKVEIKFFHV